MSNENRHVIIVVSAGEPYKALLDSGAMLPLVGSKVAEKFKDRMQEINTFVRNANSGLT